MRSEIEMSSEETPFSPQELTIVDIINPRKRSTSTLLAVGIQFGLGCIPFAIVASSGFNSTTWLSAFSSNIAVSFWASTVFTYFAGPISTYLARESVHSAVTEATGKLLNFSTMNMLEKQVGDPDLFDQLDKYILNKDRVLRDYGGNVRLVWHNNEERNILIKTTTIKFEVVNTSSEKISHPAKIAEEIKFIVDTDKYPELAGYPKATSIKTYKKYNVSTKTLHTTENYPKDEIEKVTVKTEINQEPSDGNQSDNNGIISKIVVTTRPYDIEPQQVVGFEFKIESLCEANDYVLWTIPTDRIATGMTFNIKYPTDLIMEQTPLHPSEDACKDTEEDILDESNWEISSGIFSGQGMYVSWRKC